MLNSEGLFAILSLVVGLFAGIGGALQADAGSLGFVVCIPIGIVIGFAGACVVFKLSRTLQQTEWLHL